mgnify:CR=1 FL=1
MLLLILLQVLSFQNTNNLLGTRHITARDFAIKSICHPHQITAAHLCPQRVPVPASQTSKRCAQGTHSMQGSLWHCTRWLLHVRSGQPGGCSPALRCPHRLLCCSWTVVQAAWTAGLLPRPQPEEGEVDTEIEMTMLHACQSSYCSDWRRSGELGVVMHIRIRALQWLEVV